MIARNLFFLFAALAVCSTYAADSMPETRPFYLGFTRWPADLTLEGVQTSADFSHEHGDIVSVMFDCGIPWSEALDGKPFSKDVNDKFKAIAPKGKKLFLSISPLSTDRQNLAPYWGEKDNMSLPKPWNQLVLNSPAVKKAFLNFMLRAIEAMKPDYLAVGIESNVCLSHDPKMWEQLKELHRETYTALKIAYPQLPICFTADVLHYKKLVAESKSCDQAGEVAEQKQFTELVLKTAARDTN